MSSKHPVFDEPDEDAILWRYMDFTKFVSLLSSKSLYFSRTDKLGDPFEGSYPRKNIIYREVIYKDIIDKGLHYSFGLEDHRRLSFVEIIGEFHRFHTQWTFINCWHKNEYESAAMWKVYASTSEAVAIRTNYRTLRLCLPESVLIGMVRYIDYDSEILPETNAFAPYLLKRRSFEHEKEVRAVISDLPTEGDSLLIMENPDSGRPVPVDISRLIHQVYIAPSAPSWFFDLVKDVTQHFSLKCEVRQSSLDSEPLY